MLDLDIWWYLYFIIQIWILRGFEYDWYQWAELQGPKLVPKTGPKGVERNCLSIGAKIKENYRESTVWLVGRVVLGFSIPH